MGDQSLLERRDAVLSSSYRLFYTDPVEVVSGSRAHLYGPTGEDYLDMYNNVPVIGHANPSVAAAVSAQVSTVNTHTRYLHEEVIAYAEALLATFPDALDRVTFACSGSEAVDLALRMARYATGHRGVIISELAYHGTTALAASVSPSLGPDNPLGADVVTVAPPAAAEEPAAFAARVAAACEELESRGAGVACMLFDSIFSSDGVQPEPVGALPAAAQVVRAHGGVWIADEVQPGFGRTGAMWGFERHAGTCGESAEAQGVASADNVPDLVVLGKPMGNGMPISALVHRAQVGDEFGRRVRYFNTFGGNQVSIAAAQVVLDTVLRDDLVARSAALGDGLAEEITAVGEQFDVFGAVRHAGLFIGAEVGAEVGGELGAGVGAGRLAQATVDGLREERVLISTSGAEGNVLKVRPPLVLTEADVERFAGALERVLSRLLGPHTAGPRMTGGADA